MLTDQSGARHDLQDYGMADQVMCTMLTDCTEVQDVHSSCKEQIVCIKRYLRCEQGIGGVWHSTSSAGIGHAVKQCVMP